MRKTILIIVVLALAWIGYAAWPLYDLFQLARAVERGDVEEVTRRVNFSRVRMSLAQQIVEAYLQRTGARPNPLVQGAAASIADPIVAKVISPEALAELLRVGWPKTVLANQPREAVGISVPALGNVWDLFAASDYGIVRYEVTVPVSSPPDRGFRLQLRLAQWRWRLTAVRLPEPIRLLLADEIIKSTKPQAQ
jgi:Protein of unknown function (DUF2939)